MKKLFVVAIVIFSFSFSKSHEGHDKVPGLQIAKMSPPGQVKMTSHLFVEVKEENGIVKVLIFDHDRKDIPTKDLTIAGNLKFPKKMSSQKVHFLPVGNMFEASIDSKKSHRYALYVSITYGGKTEKLSFNIEPQY